MTWTHFWDMNSGGGLKEDVKHIFIEAPEDEARSVFYARFGHSPDRVSCTCCDADYDVSAYDTLERATAYERGCAWSDDDDSYVERWSGNSRDTYMTLDEYVASGKCRVIPASDIKASERTVDVPRQGYIWQD